MDDKTPKMEYRKLSDDELVQFYADIINEMKQRGIIRTNNVLGEIGEHLAIKHYCDDPTLPDLIATEVGQQNYDAICAKSGERYSIKTTSGRTTGVFHGLNPEGSTEPDTKVFDYVVICKFDKSYSLIGIYQITWDTFIHFKSWHSRMNAWNLTLSRKLIDNSKIIYRSH